MLLPCIEKQQTFFMWKMEITSEVKKSWRHHPVEQKLGKPRENLQTTTKLFPSRMFINTHAVKNLIKVPFLRPL